MYASAVSDSGSRHAPILRTLDWRPRPKRLLLCSLAKYHSRAIPSKTAATAALPNGRTLRCGAQKSNDYGEATPPRALRRLRTFLQTSEASPIDRRLYRE